MKVQHVDEREYGFFQLLEETNQIGKIEYRYEGPTKIVITHTEVASSHQGKDLGKNLVTQVIDFIKEKDLQLKSECPYASAIIEKNNEYRKMVE